MVHTSVLLQAGPVYSGGHFSGTQSLEGSNLMHMLLVVIFQGFFCSFKMHEVWVGVMMTPVWYVFMAAASTSSSIFFKCISKNHLGGGAKRMAKMRLKRG